MRLHNVESRAFSPARADGTSAVNEELQVLDSEGNIAMRFIKTAAGLVAFEIDGVTVASSADFTPETLTDYLAANVDMFDGVLQVETATVIAAAGCTANGDLIVTVTSAIAAGSPLDVVVPLTTTEDSSTKVATEIKTALNAVAAVTDVYTIGGTGATVTLTAKTKAANDATLNIDINADDVGTTAEGITNAPTSANTTGGVATVIADTITALPLSVSLEAGAKYEITFKAPVDAPAAAATFDFGGSTATATNFVGNWVWSEDADPSITLGARVTALGTDFTGGGAAGQFVFIGTIEVNAGGIFVPRAQQASANVTATTVLRGATLKAVKV